MTRRCESPALGPEFFEEQRGPGAPKKLARDVAVMLAMHLGLHRLWELGEKQKITKAESYVVQLWMDKGFIGITDVSNVSARIKKANEAGVGNGVLLVVSGANGCPGLVILFDDYPEWAGRSDCAVASGCGWVWTEGEERAKYGMINGVELPWPDHGTVGESNLRAAVSGALLGAEWLAGK